MSLVGLLILVLVFVLFGYLIRLIPDATAQKIAWIVLVVMAIVVLLNGVGWIGGPGWIRIG
jgi:hypothetical protein